MAATTSRSSHLGVGAERDGGLRMGSAVLSSPRRVLDDRRWTGEAPSSAERLNAKPRSACTAGAVLVEAPSSLLGDVEKTDQYTYLLVDPRYPPWRVQSPGSADSG
jgi:hypothetical protein